MRTASRLVLLALAAAALAVPAAASAAPKTVWLCRPGLAKNPCGQSQKTTVFTPAGKKVRVENTKAAAKPKIDCFYVYPTVSDQKTDLSTLRIDPEERSIALYQAARYAQTCRVFAPMYRQHTLAFLTKLQAGKAKGGLNATQSIADLKQAWQSYLKHDNHGRGVVFIGHSQGAFLLRSFLAKEVDPKPALRKLMLSAILLGGNVLVKKGSDHGGDFKHIRACHSGAQLGCVVAFSTYNATPPANSLFGRVGAGIGATPAKSLQVLCTNPTLLAGTRGKATTEFPSAPFAPKSTIALGINLLNNRIPTASTAWISVPNAYQASCSKAGGASVLRIKALNGAPVLKASPNATWGLHLVDANIALGNLVGLVRSETAAFVKRAKK